MCAKIYKSECLFRKYIAGWSSLVARRAHNPKVAWFKSRPRNQRRKRRIFSKTLHSKVFLFYRRFRRSFAKSASRFLRFARLRRVYLFWANPFGSP